MESEKIEILKNRIIERMNTTASNLIYDPDDYFDDLSDEESFFIKTRLQIEIKVFEGDS